MLAGVYLAKKKDGTEYYRASITYQNKHISLGSYSTERQASLAYKQANHILHTPGVTLNRHRKNSPLPFTKWVCLLNFRDNGMYIKTPVYLKDTYFIYYFSKHDFLTFDVDDLFFYTTHSIMRRGNHLFVADYGMQVNILSRYGIKSFAVAGRDYRFINGDSTDLRYSNIEIINPYFGVRKKTKKGHTFYETRIHIKCDFIVGRYDTLVEAAVAYNKAATELIKKGYDREYNVNYIEETDETTYKEIFQSVKISDKILTLPDKSEQET